MSYLLHRRKAFRGGGGDSPGTSNLLLWLSLDDGSPSTTAADAHTTGEDFTITNGDWVGSGKVGADAYNNDAAGEYLSSDTTIAPGSTSVTVNFWLNSDNIGAGDHYLFEMGNRWFTVNGGFSLKWEQSTNRFYGAMRGNGSQYREEYATGPTTGSWVMVTVTFDQTANSNAGEVIIYYDGTAQSMTTSTDSKSSAPNLATATMYIAANSTGAQDFSGDFDEFAVFSKVLTQAEIDFLYNSGSGVGYSDL